MGHKLKFGIVLQLIFLWIPLAGKFNVYCDSDKIKAPEGNLVRKFLYDTVALQYELFSVESLKLLAIFGPLYIAGRVADDQVHSCFYCPNHHKNCRSLPSSLTKALLIFPVPLSIGISLLALNPWDEDLAVAARVFASGLVPLCLVKDFFKNFKHEGCLRPRCEFFSKTKKYYGGCPSGHMAFMAYATTLFGLEYGASWGVPLGLLSVAVFSASINCNRHFVSQLIAGTGLGIAYGVAGHKVVDCYKKNSFSCDILVDEKGPALQVGYSF